MLGGLTWGLVVVRSNFVQYSREMSVDKSGMERLRRLKGIVAAAGPPPTKMDYDTYQSIQFGRTPYRTQLANGAIVEENCCPASPEPPLISR